MQKIFISIFILILSTLSALSQSLNVFDIDTTNFPIMKAKFYAFDSNYFQILNLQPSDFSIKEDGIPRKVTNISCPAPKPIQNVSLAISLDFSGSMRRSDFGYIQVEFGKLRSTSLCSEIAMPPSEFDIQNCNDKSMNIKDFTSSR